MALLPILQDGEKVLREHALPVPASLFGSEKLDTMLGDMADTLANEADGVALAAPQVGIPYRIFVVRYDRMIERGEERSAETGPDLGIFINPEFVKTSRKQEEMQEGCLSVRGLYGVTLRHAQATVKAQDEHGVWFTRGGGGILAQAYQHEMDHLDGILFTDHAEEVREQAREEAKHAAEPA